MKYCHGWLRLDENNLVSDNNYDTINPRSPKKCYKEWKTMLGDTTLGFTMSIEQLVTLNTTFSYHSNRQHLVLISNIKGGIWPLNKHENLHFDIEWYIHMSCINYVKNGYDLELGLSTNFEWLYVSCLSRSGLVGKSNHLRPICLSEILNNDMTGMDNVGMAWHINSYAQVWQARPR